MNNKFTTYLLYGIGEIILVVVGILIAVNIDDWNKESERTQLEKKVLLELLDNLKIDSIDHSLNHRDYSDLSQSAHYVVTQLENKAEWNDSMRVHYAKTFVHAMSTLNMAAYENLKSVGFNLITNDTLRNKITYHYGVEYNRLTKFENEFIDNQTNMITPLATRHLRIYSWGEAVPINYEDLLEEEEFKEVVRWKKTANGYVARLFKNARINTMELMDSIREELDKPRFK